MDHVGCATDDSRCGELCCRRCVVGEYLEVSSTTFLSNVASLYVIWFPALSRFIILCVYNELIHLRREAYV